MNWFSLILLLPLAGLYYLFFGNGRGYRLIHSPQQLFSSPELRFRYTGDQLAQYFFSVEHQEQLTAIWRWKYAASAVFLLVMTGIIFNFDMPGWLHILMLTAAGLRTLLAFLETGLLLSLQRRHLQDLPLHNDRLCSLLTSLKWIVTLIWVAGLFGLLLLRAAALSK